MRWQHLASLSALLAATTLAAQDTSPRPRPTPRTDRSPGIVPPGALVRSPAPTTAASGTARGERATVTHMKPTYQRLSEGSPFTTILARERMGECPSRAYWESLPILDQIQMMARTGFIPAEPFPTDKAEFSHWTMAASGWRVYGFLVPPGGQVRVDLSHPKPAWFRVFWTDKWGEFRPGMKMSMGNPSCLYENLSAEVQPVFCMVDDPGLWSTEKDPYTLTVKRSWDPATLDPKGATLAVGIWATPNRALPQFR